MPIEYIILLGVNHDRIIRAKERVIKVTGSIDKPTSLPPRLRPLFWDYQFSKLSWDEDRDLVIARVLSAGDWESVRWVMQTLGKPALKSWIEQREGRGLDARRLRFWEVVLGIPHRVVSRWIKEGEPTWNQRASP